MSCLEPCFSPSAWILRVGIFSESEAGSRPCSWCGPYKSSSRSDVKVCIDVRCSSWYASVKCKIHFQLPNVARGYSEGRLAQFVGVGSLLYVNRCVLEEGRTLLLSREEQGRLASKLTLAKGWGCFLGVWYCDLHASSEQVSPCHIQVWSAVVSVRAGNSKKWVRFLHQINAPGQN